jgi:hypothetical protein
MKRFLRDPEEAEHLCNECGGYWYACACPDRCEECDGLLNEDRECTSPFCEQSWWKAAPA